MSGIEVIGIVASLVSAFHGGAELIKLYKKRRAKRREKRQKDEQELHRANSQDEVLQDMLEGSLEEGEAVVRNQFRNEQRVLGQYSQLLRSGDDQAKQELLMIAVSLQAQVIASLGRAQENMQVIVELAQLKDLHEATILRRHEATRSITELRQRIEVTLPIPRISADSAMGIGISRRNSNESLARTFVTAAANLCITEPTAQRLLTVPPILSRQQSQMRGHGRSIMTLSSYQYLIPEIRAQDIDILTLAGEPINHDTAQENFSSSSDTTTPRVIEQASSSSSLSPPADRPEIQTYPPGIAGQYLNLRKFSQDTPSFGRTQSYSTLSNAPEIIRALSAPAKPTVAPEPDADLTSHLHPASHIPYCPGALAAQHDFRASFTLLNLPLLPGSHKLHPSWKCHSCDFNASDGDGTLLQRIEFAHGVRYRFPFCARSHAPYTHPPGAFKPKYTYGCLFCTAEGKVSAVHHGVDALMEHIAAKHRTNLTPDVRVRTHSVVGRVAGREEGWDVNLPDVTERVGRGVGKWMFKAVTSL